MRKICFLLLILLTACAPSEQAIQTSIAQTQAAWTPTASPAPTLIPTSTATPIPQSLLLRSACSSDYMAKAGEPILLIYGSWPTEGEELATQWYTSLFVNLVVDGRTVDGEPQQPAADLPLNCPDDYENSYWNYYQTTLPPLVAGVHYVTVTFGTLHELPDAPNGQNYPVGFIGEDTFRIIVE